jgi:predicted nucleic acid-binding protein
MIYAQLRRDAKPIPTNDIWIAAVVSFYKGTALYTQDPHFQHVRGLQIVPDAATFRKIFE